MSASTQKVGDIIEFKDAENPGEFFSARIVEMTEKGFWAVIDDAASSQNGMAVLMERQVIQ